jgi:hypothetical protein
MRHQKSLLQQVSFKQQGGGNSRKTGARNLYTLHLCIIWVQQVIKYQYMHLLS